MDLNFTQRWRRNGMSEERQNLLDEIGFVWNVEEYKERSAAGARKRIKKSRPETQELFSVGTLVLKYFDGDGWFLGEISSNTTGYRVLYEDGDREFYALDSEQLMEMVDDARDMTADELLLDPDADEDDDAEIYDDNNDDDEKEEKEDGLFSNEPLEGKEKEVEDERFATPGVKDEESFEEYSSALEEEEGAEKKEDEILSESEGDEEETDTEEKEQHPKPAPRESRFSLFQDRVYSFFGSKTNNL